MLRHRNRSMLLAGACLLAACANGGGAGDTLPPTTRATGPAPATTEPASSTTTTTTSSTTTTVGATVVTDASVPPTSVPPTLQLSADGPWHRVDSAPGITTPGLVYELMPKLWVYLPTEQDLEHGIVWTLHNPDDIPVIEAYLQAELTYYTAVTSTPINLELHGWKRFYVDGGQLYFADLMRHRSLGESADLDAGVVLRPEVIGDDRSDRAAIVFDCVSDGGVFLRVDGSLAEGSTRGIGKHGLATWMVRSDLGWMVSKAGSEPAAC